MSTKKQTAFRLPDDLRAQLEQEAGRLGLSLNATLIVTLRRALPAAGATPPTTETLQPPVTDDDDPPMSWE